MPKLIDGASEMRRIACRPGPSSAGYGNWSLRLLARPVLESVIADSIKHETVRRVLGKRHHRGQVAIWSDPSLGGYRVHGRHGRGARY